MVKLSSKSDKFMEEILIKLGLSGGAIRVYTKLLELKEASAKRLSDTTGIARTSVYDYVLELGKLSLCVELDVNSKKVFRPDDPEHLLDLLDKRAKELESERKVLKRLLPDLKSGLVGGEPRVKFYPGEEGFVAVLGDILRSGAKEALFLWPFGEMTQRIGEEYLQDFTYRRKHTSLAIRSIWPGSIQATRNKAHLNLSNEKIRIAPANCGWGMAALIYGDKVAFVSSRKEAFAFTVQSRDFAELQKTQFEEMWKNSKPVKK